MRLITLGVMVLTFIASPATADNIRIGVAGPMTGGLAAFGEQMQHGAQLALERINQQNGLLGRQLSLSIQDDACDPQQAHIVANKMASEKTTIVFGHWCSLASIAASSVYGEENILQIDVGGLLQKFTQQGFPTLFRTSANSKSFASAVGDYTSAHNRNANVSIVTDQPAITKEFTQELLSYFNAHGNKIVAVENIRGGDKDFSSLIDRLKLSQPQVVICSCYTIEAGLLARQLIDKKLDVFYYGWDTLNSPDFLNIVGSANMGKIVSIDYARAPETKEYKILAAQLRKRHWPVETTTLLTYASVEIFAAAVQSAKSIDSGKIVAALHSQTFTTIIGDVSFDRNGDRITPDFASYKWVNGNLLMGTWRSHGP